MASSDNDASASSLLESPLATPSSSPAKVVTLTATYKESQDGSVSPQASKEGSVLPMREDNQDIRIDHLLPTPAQLFIAAQLPSILNNKKYFQLLPDQKDGPKEGVKYLKLLCLVSLGLCHSGSKKLLVKWLVKYFFHTQVSLKGNSMRM